MPKFVSAFACALMFLSFLLTPAAVFGQQDDGGGEDAAVDQADQAESPARANDFWFGIGGEGAWYGVAGFAFGGSFAIGYGSGISIGLKGALLFNKEIINTLELNLLLRFYLLGKSSYKGPFLDLITGVSLFNRKGSFHVPSSSGMLNAGLCFGWRFVFLNRLYLEPSIRGGYPYLLGAGVSAGIRL